ncbi:1-phosphatidylinositol 4 [Diplonema papillatum]|nr:1-phosphatidylinositol 4 [Diplonema papillatum]
MGCCSSKDARKPNTGKRRHSAPREPLRQNSAISTTGIMDELAPETTAPKLDTATEEMSRMVVTLTDVLRGERLIIDNRVPESENEIRLKLYAQVILVVREAVQVLNEEITLGLAGRLPPSHVMDLLVSSCKQACSGERVPLPVPTIRKAKISSACMERKPFVETWLALKGAQGNDVPRAFAEKLGVTAGCGFASSTQLPADGSYCSVMSEWLAFEEKKYKVVLDRFLSAAPSGALTAAVAEKEFSIPRTVFDKRLEEDGIIVMQAGFWTRREYLRFLFDADANSGSDHELLQRKHVMTFPLHDYYIDCSTNTWLVSKNQMTSDSALSRVREVLLAGCRTIELEVHDGPKGEPLVHLAWTKNKPLDFRDCLSVVVENAFKASPYPVILSLCLRFGMETDASDQMETAAKYLKEVLGDALGRWSEGGEPPSNHSPESLKNKFLIEAPKRWHEIAKSARAQRSEVPERSPRRSILDVIHLGLSLVNIKSRAAVKVKSVTEGSAASLAGLTEESFIEAIVPKDTNDFVKVKSVEELTAHLNNFNPGDDVKLKVNQRILKLLLPHQHAAASPMHNNNSFLELTNAKKEEDIDSSDEDRPEVIRKSRKVEIASKFNNAGHKYKKAGLVPEISELAFLKKRKRPQPDKPCEEEDVHPDRAWWESDQVPMDKLGPAADEIRDTKSHFVHVYPQKGSLKSENPNAALPWSLGAQLVGINYHNRDMGYLMNRARFAENGGCGYLLKPPHLRNDVQQEQPQPKEVKVTIHALAAQITRVQPPPTDEQAANGDNDPPFPNPDASFTMSIKSAGPDGVSSETKSEPSKMLAWQDLSQTLVVQCKETNFFVVMLQADEFCVGTAVISLNTLRSGLRSFELCHPEASDEKDIVAVVVCKIDFEEKA